MTHLKKELEQQGKVGTEAKTLKKEIEDLRASVQERDRKNTEVSESLRRLEEYYFVSRKKKKGFCFVLKIDNSCIFSTCRENQGLAREKKLTSAKVETLQEQLASSKAEATSHGKGRDDLARQMTMLKEEATKGASLDRANADLKKQLQDLEAKASEADLHSKQAESALAATTRAKNRIELEKETQITQVTSQLEEQLKLVGNGFFFPHLEERGPKILNASCFSLTPQSPSARPSSRWKRQTRRERMMNPRSLMPSLPEFRAWRTVSPRNAELSSS